MAELTIGVEEELQLVDRASSQLRGRAHEVVARAADRPHPASDDGTVEHELQLSQVEIVTPVCSTLSEVRTELVRLRRKVRDAAEAEGCRALSAGTHPNGRWSDQTVTPKWPYETIRDDYAQLSREQVVFGCHVHLSVEDPELRVQAMNQLRPWLSPLLALTASSPFWEGNDTGYASYRYLVFSRWPTFLTPSVFSSWAEFGDHLELLQTTGSIDAPGRLYWTVRPSARFETLEFRIGDACTTVDEAVLMAGLVRALVQVSLQRAEAGDRPPAVRAEAVPAAEWRAARYGLDATLVDLTAGRQAAATDVIAAFVDHVRPGLEDGGDGAEVLELLDRVLTDGNSARRQRRVFARTGSLTAVVDHLDVETAAGV